MKKMKLVHKLFATGAFLSLTGMILVVGIQVFSRFFLETTPHWTEEAARIFFIYAVAFGTGTGIVNGDFIRLNIIGKLLSSRQDKLLQLITDIIIITLSIILIIYSLEFVALGMDERTPALQITTGYVFISMVIIGLAILIFTLENLCRSVKGFNRQ